VVVVDLELLVQLQLASRVRLAVPECSAVIPVIMAAVVVDILVEIVLVGMTPATRVLEQTSPDQ
jgi:hypothetical protein